MCSGGVTLRSCAFGEAQTGVLTLAPHAQSRLALLLMGNSIGGLQDVVSLATPTIPPMTRSPVTLPHTPLIRFIWWISWRMANCCVYYLSVTSTFGFCSTVLFFCRLLHIWMVSPEASEENLWELLKRDFLQAGCPSRRPTNNIIALRQ